MSPSPPLPRNIQAQIPPGQMMQSLGTGAGAGTMQGQDISGAASQQALQGLQQAVGELKAATEKIYNMAQVVNPSLMSLLVPIATAGKQLEGEVMKSIQAAGSKQPTRPTTPQEGSGNPAGAPPAGADTGLAAA